MKLGTKIIMGFVGILAILIILGCVAVYQMYGVQKKADILANEYIPEVKQMLTLTQKTYLMRLQALGIALSGKEKYYKGAQTARNELKDELTKFKKLVDNSEKLESGRKTAPLLIKGVDDYWTAADGMNTAMVEIAKYRKKRGVVGKDILALADTLVLKQKEKLERATPENVASYVESYQNASQIPLLMYKIRLGSSFSWANSNMEAMKKIIKEDFTLISAKVKAVAKNDPATADDVKKLLDYLKDYQGLMEDTVASWQNLNKYLSDAVDVGTNVVNQTVEVGAKASDATLVVAADTNSALSSASIVLMVGLSIATIVGILLAVIITRGITGPINRIINNLNESGEQVAAASGQISSASQSLAEGATEQAASLEESSSALEEMASMTRQNADNAGNANQMMIETQKQVSNGAESVQNMASAMSEINDSSEQISRIIKTIEEIAFQTNLLALNAAVEAARAGDAGKGFAVVADEVRNLAQRSAQAARDTADLIESTVARVKNGTEIVEELQESFGNVEKAANGVAGLINEISAASTEQAQGVDQVNTAVAQMDKVTQTNAANAEESASAAEELNAQAEQLRSLVGALVKLVRGKDAVVDSHTSMSVPKLHANRPLSLPHSSRSSGGSSAPAKRIESSTAKLVKPHDVIPLDDDDDDFSDF